MFVHMHAYLPAYTCIQICTCAGTYSKLTYIYIYTYRKTYTHACIHACMNLVCIVFDAWRHFERLCETRRQAFSHRGRDPRLAGHGSFVYDALFSVARRYHNSYMVCNGHIRIPDHGPILRAHDFDLRR